MNSFLTQLKTGGLNSDGEADKVAEAVLHQPERLNELFSCLQDENDVVRGHAAHALEKVSRQWANKIHAHLQELIHIAQNDSVSFVKWHLAMVFANLLPLNKDIDLLADALLFLLEDDSALVKSWAISGLCLLGRLAPDKREEILTALKPLRYYHGTAIRNRASKAVDFLKHPYLSIPPSWIKVK